MDSAQYEQWQKWRRWAEIIHHDISRLALNQETHDGFLEVIEANLNHIMANNGGVFCQHVVGAHAIQIMMGIRRHLKKDKRSVSFLGLLQDMRGNLDNLTPEVYSQMYRHSGFALEWHHNPYRFLCGTGKKVTAELIDSDIQKLKELSKKIEVIADKALAHLEDRQIKDVSKEEADEALNAFKNMAIKYVAFLRCLDSITLHTWEDRDWKKIFKVPLDIR